MKYKLDDIEKKETLKVPDGYFEDLPMKIQQRISTETKPQLNRIPSWSLALAASLLLLVTFVFILPHDDPSPEELLAEIPQNEIAAYLDQIDLDEYDIASAIGDEANELEFENTDVLDGIDLDDEAIDDVLLEYDLADEYL
ncbi:hypothetical protein [Ekhidna sp. To15]|uniref:hypothetical protein n=1 Tax=Ekhidna sp. To15 TaxID=3395267 RepID=UPI003F529060